MTRTTTFLSTAAALGLMAAFTTSASAMTCTDFMGMDEDSQMTAVNEMMGGRQDARDDANNADGAETGDGDSTMDGDAAVSMEDKDGDTGGREAAREEARGAEMITRIMDECAKDSSMDLDEIISATQ